MTQRTPSAFRTLRTLALAAGALLAAPPAWAQPERPPSPPPTRLFQIVVLVASPQGTDSLADLPANTRTAVEDVRSFLPFRSYRAVDTALVRTAKVARTVMKGADDAEYQVSFSIGPRPAPLPPGAGRPEESARAAAASVIDVRFEVLGLAATKERPTEADIVMTTSFSAEPGKTVVVGSSRLGGGDALVFLFTALP